MKNKLSFFLIYKILNSLSLTLLLTSFELLFLKIWVDINLKEYALAIFLSAKLQNLDGV